MSKNILHIEIQPVRAALDRFGHALQNLEEGKTIEPYYGIGFETPPQFARVFTEKRWELIAALKDAGPLTIYALAKQLHRHYRNVYKDIQALMEWSVVEKDGDGHVSIPWDAIDVRLPLKRALPGMVHPPSGEGTAAYGVWRSEALLWVDWEVLVLITGASSGIGAATARAFVKAGSSVMAAARRRDRLQSLAEELGPKLLPLQLDVRAPATLSKLPESLPQDFSEVDVLVNNAGLALGLEPADRAQMDDWQTMIDTNISGIGSIAGSYPYPGGNVYGATKAFVRQFSLNLRADLAGTALRVTNIEPGLCETEFSQVRFKGDAAKAAAPYQGTQPLTAADIAESIVWVATRPAHVNINRLELMPVAQSFSAFHVHRES